MAQFFGSPAPWALGRGQKFNFLNMVMWHIKLKGICSRPGYTENYNLKSNWWLWHEVKGSIAIRFLRERGGLRWRAIKSVLVFHAFCCRLLTFFKIYFFKKILSPIPLECQTVWIQMRTGPDLGPNCLQRLSADVTLFTSELGKLVVIFWWF